MALLTPVIWAVACLIDSCLVGERIYSIPTDGVAISFLFSLFPVALFTIVKMTNSDSAHEHVDAGSSSLNLKILFYSVLAGLAYVAHLWCYFKTLFLLNDVSGAETFLSLSVLVVPFFAWLFLGEVLPPRYYLAFLIAAVGVMLLSWSSIRFVGSRILVLLLMSVITISLSMVCQSEALKEGGYALATLGFNLTCVFSAGVLFVRRVGQLGRVIQLIRQYPVLLMCGELLGVIAVLSTHRATEYAPSVSLVAMIECLLPILIILLSLLLIRINRHLPVLSSTHQRTLAQQLVLVPEKMLALFLMLLAMAMIPV